MAGYMIDTAAAIDGLTAEGIPANQARAIVRTVAQRNEEVATKSDIVALKSDIRGLEADMRALESRLNMKAYLMAASVVAALKALEYLGIKTWARTNGPGCAACRMRSWPQQIAGAAAAAFCRMHPGYEEGS